MAGTEFRGFLEALNTSFLFKDRSFNYGWLEQGGFLCSDLFIFYGWIPSQTLPTQNLMEPKRSEP